MSEFNSCPICGKKLPKGNTHQCSKNSLKGIDSANAAALNDSSSLREGRDPIEIGARLGVGFKMMGLEESDHEWNDRNDDREFCTKCGSRHTRNSGCM